MADPLSFLPYALAAGGGHVDEWECGRLVAAGLTLRARSASLTRALLGHPAAVCLPPSAAFLTALAAADGHPLWLLDPDAPTWPDQSSPSPVVFSARAFADHLPSAALIVWLDDAPRSAELIDPVAGDAERRLVDLGSHFGLPLTGDREVAGATESCLVELRDDNTSATYTHRDLLSAVRAVVKAPRHDIALTPVTRVEATNSWHRVDDFVHSACAPLYMGATVTTVR